MLKMHKAAIEIFISNGNFIQLKVKNIEGKPKYWGGKG